MSCAGRDYVRNSKEVKHDQRVRCATRISAMRRQRRPKNLKLLLLYHVWKFGIKFIMFENEWKIDGPCTRNRFSDRIPNKILFLIDS